MKSPLVTGLAIACALAFAIAAQAQQTAPREHTMTGCLKKGTEADTYMLTDVEKVNTIGVVASTANLAPHVGHKVAVTGTAVPAKEAEADKNVPKAAHYMKLTAVKHVAPTCP